ncbi:MAG: choice-of-anchor B family protein [Crocinitomicaceae bacterium]|nr:choice-of-anchor B family protein [Crocinitomicaceae bacterium]
MKKLFILIILTLSLSVYSQSSSNISLVGSLDYPGTEGNDVWGYVDPLGNEYGLVGAREGTGVVDLSDPTNPTEVFWEVGMNSIWRDIKTWESYAYVTTEAQNGLLIIDLTPLPTSTALSTTYYWGEVGSEWQSAHNLYIDSSGYCYIFGANRGNGGVIILDLDDPLNPQEVGVFDNWYVHDGYVRNDTMFLAHISDGFISMVDVTDKANPVLLGTKGTPSNFSHNIWPTDDGQFAFTTDELPFSYVAAYDVSDPTNMIEVDRIESSPGVGVIPHNVHVLGDYLVTSHYADGVVIHDVTYPYNMIEVGDFDTYPTQTTGYDGCWGAYPFLPSGIVLATDITEGFFVLGPTYTKAAYLEGIITDAATGGAIDMAEIEIVGSEHTESSNSTGFYATGIVTGGTYDVVYSKVGYFPQTVSVSLLNGVITNQDIQLVPIPPYNLTVTVLDAVTGNPIDDADIVLKADLIKHEGVSNGLGEETFVLFYEEEYDIIVGKWGFVTDCFEQIIDATTGEITVSLQPGYYDDFTFDFGWATSGSASTGLWERGVPFGTSSNSAPSEDAINDCGEIAFVTGNEMTTDADLDDVDDGTAILISPVMNLTGLTDPYVNYMRWFYCQFGPNGANDSLYVEVSNGIQSVQIDVVKTKSPTDPTFQEWNVVSLRLSDYIAITNTMQFFFRTGDLDPDINITEAGVDYFYISDGVSSIEEVEDNDLVIYPNPTSGLLSVEGLETAEEYSVFNMQGQKVLFGTLVPEQNKIQFSSVESGVYFLHLNDNITKIFKTN